MTKSIISVKNLSLTWYPVLHYPIVLIIKTNKGSAFKKQIPCLFYLIYYCYLLSISSNSIYSPTILVDFGTSLVCLEVFSLVEVLEE